MEIHSALIGNQPKELLVASYGAGVRTQDAVQVCKHAGYFRGGLESVNHVRPTQNDRIRLQADI